MMAGGSSLSRAEGYRGLAVFVRASAYPTPRVQKNMKVAREAGFDVVFVGARRLRQSRAEQVVVSADMVKRVGIYYPEGSGWLYLAGTVVFALAVFVFLLRRRAVLVHASDADAMLGVVLYRMFGGRSRIVYNIHDNFALRRRYPDWLRNRLGRLEASLGERADVVMVPDEARLELLMPWRPREAVVIPNAPEDPGYTQPRTGEVVRILMAGKLAWGRGIEVMGGLVRERSDVEVVVCGLGPPDVMRFVEGLPRTDYRGYLPQEQVFEIAQGVDLLYAVYDPAIPINRFASPNKVFDGMAVGRPIIVNEEAQVGRWVRSAGVGFAVRYGSLEDLIEVVERVRCDPDIVRRYGQTGRAKYEAEYQWDVLGAKVLAAFVGGDG